MPQPAVWCRAVDNQVVDGAEVAGLKPDDRGCHVVTEFWDRRPGQEAGEQGSAISVLQHHTAPAGRIRGGGQWLHGGLGHVPRLWPQGDMSCPSARHPGRNGHLPDPVNEYLVQRSSAASSFVPGHSSPGPRSQKTVITRSRTPAFRESRTVSTRAAIESLPPLLSRVWTVVADDRESCLSTGQARVLVLTCLQHPRAATCQAVRQPYDASGPAELAGSHSTTTLCD